MHKTKTSRNQRFEVLISFKYDPLNWNQFFLFFLFFKFNRSPQCRRSSGLNQIHGKPHSSKPSKPICLARTTNLTVFVLFATPVAGWVSRLGYIFCAPPSLPSPIFVVFFFINVVGCCTVVGCLRVLCCCCCCCCPVVRSAIVMRFDPKRDGALWKSSSLLLSLSLLLLLLLSQG